jgi:hypothetical protein
MCTTAGKVLDADGKPLVLPSCTCAPTTEASPVFGNQFGNQIPGYTRATLTCLDVCAGPRGRRSGARRQFRQVQVGLSGESPTGRSRTVARTQLDGNVFSVNGYFDPDGQTADHLSS